MPEVQDRLRQLLTKVLSGSIARNTLKTTVVFGARLAAQAATLVLLARLLGPARFGEFSAIAALAVLFGTLSTLGTHLVLLGETAIDPTRRTGILKFAIPTTLVCGTVLLLGYLTVIRGVFHPEVISLTAIALIGITELVLQPLLQLACGELQGLGKAPLALTLQHIPLFFRALLLCGMLFVETTHTLGIYALGYCLVSILAIFLIQGYLPAWWPAPWKCRFPRGHEIRNAIGYAFLNLSSAGTSEVDKSLSPALVGTSQAGLYIVGTRILGALTLPMGAMMIAALPRIFRSCEQNSDIRVLRKWIFIISATYGLGIGFVLWLFAPVFIFILGPHYLQLPVTLTWIAFICPAVCLRCTGGALLMGMKCPWLRCAAELSGIVMFVLIAPLLAKHFAYSGFIAALLISEWIMATVVWTSLMITHRSYMA